MSRHLGGRPGLFTFTPDEVHSEWIIPVGARLLAVGSIRRIADGRAALTAQGDVVALVSTKPEQQILSRNRTAAEGPHLPFTPARAVVLIAGVPVLAVVIAVFVFVNR